VGDSDQHPAAAVLSRRFLQLNVKSITGRWHNINAKNTDKIESIKATIRAQEGPGDYRGKGLMFVHDAPEWQDVLYLGEVLDDQRTLQSYHVLHDADLHIVRRRRMLPQDRSRGCGICHEAPCCHMDAEDKYGPDMHWSDAYGWNFPGKIDPETHELVSPEFELKLPPGGLKAQRLRTGPQNSRGDVALQMDAEVKRDEAEQDHEDSREGEQDSSEDEEDDQLIDTEAKDKEAVAKPEKQPKDSRVEPEDELSDSEDRGADGEHEDESDKPKKVQKRWWQKKWVRQYCYEVKLGFRQLVAGWTDSCRKPAESEFEPSERFQEALNASIDTETALNLSYQDLGHPYQWQYFVKMVPYFENLRELNLSKNRLSELPGFDMPHLERLNLSWNRFDNLSGVPAMGELRELDLTGNNLDTAKGIYKFQNLESLCLRENPVEYKYLYLDRVKARAPSSLIWLDGKPFEPVGWNLHYVLKLMFQSDHEDQF